MALVQAKLAGPKAAGTPKPKPVVQTVDFGDALQAAFINKFGHLGADAQMLLAHQCEHMALCTKCRAGSGQHRVQCYCAGKFFSNSAKSIAAEGRVAYLAFRALCEQRVQDLHKRAAVQAAAHEFDIKLSKKRDEADAHAKVLKVLVQEKEKLDAKATADAIKKNRADTKAKAYDAALARLMGL